MASMIHVYRSTDAGAPVLNSTAGSLIAVLDACLVNGYGSKPSAGWTKAFSGTNKAAYRMPATDLAGTTSATLQAYLRVDDTILQTALVRGYESMTDLDTGGHSFPIENAYWPKSNLSSSIAVSWWLFTDGLLFYLFMQYRTDFAPDIAVFGEYVSHRVADASPLIINGSHEYSYQGGPRCPGFRQLSGVDSQKLSRNYVGDTFPVEFRSLTGATSGLQVIGGISTTPYPGRANAGFVAEPYYIQEFVSNTYYVRGVHPGLAVTWERVGDSVTMNTQFANVHGAPGRTFEVMKIHGNNDVLLVDITGPWR